MTSKDPRKSEKLAGAVTVFSNSYGTSTGYGVQVTQLIDRLKRHGVDVAMQSNYGLEGRTDEIATPFGKVQHYARGWDSYSNDVAPMNHFLWKAKHPDLKDLMITLYDVWVLNNPQFDKIPIASWTPVDHATMPPKVEAWLRKDNVTPIAMAPNGDRLMTEKGIDHLYIPHSVNTKIFKPTHEMPTGQNVREYMGSKDRFVVGMVAANKASGAQHRKSFGENLMAFSIFKKRHPEAMLYLHTEPLGLTSGWKLLDLIKSLDLPHEDVVFPDPMAYRVGVPDAEMAALYTGMDVLLGPSMGEGFGVPTIEAQACGTRVIVSNWAASPDLTSSDSWVVDGQPTWDSLQSSWWFTPSVPSIVAALEQAYQAGQEKSDTAIKFAKNFDTERVWFDNWMPALKKLLQD